MGEALDSLDQYAELLSVLGNVNRLKIIFFLRSGAQKVGDISKHINRSQSSTSQHLAALRAQNIVLAQRNGNEILYEFNLNGPLDFLTWEKMEQGR